MLDINPEFEKFFAEFEKQAEVPAQKLTESKLKLPVPYKFLSLSMSKSNKNVCVPNTFAARFVLQHSLSECPETIEDLKKLVSSSPQL
jgi:hypothetical protein